MKSNPKFTHRRLLLVTGASILLSAIPIAAPADDVVSGTVVTRAVAGSKRVLDATDARIAIDPNETVHIDLRLLNKPGQAKLVAPNGGSFNGGKKTLAIDTSKSGPAFGLDFSAGPNPGRYTVEITHGNTTRTLEFWAGQEPPRGKPGPQLTFNR